MPRSTAPILDGAGNTVQATLYPPGREAAADSFSVALSTEDKSALDGMSAKLPATLGAKAAAQSLAVTLAADGAGVSALTSIAGMAVPAHDHIALGYTGDNLTTVTYKTGGSGGTTVATLTLAYSGSTLTSITRS